jgi:serine/threonine protein kinase
LRAILTVREGKGVGRRYVIRLGQRLVVGRSRDVAIRLEDKAISREHVLLELRVDGLAITDLGSLNGSVLDGVPLRSQEPRQAHHEHSLQLGEHTLRVEVEGVEEMGQATQPINLPSLPREEFEILGLLGRGSAGEVYSAEQRILKRRVAVKVLRPSEDDPTLRERFIQEGRLACRIVSPYVVQVHDVRLIGDQVFLIMELVDGVSLRDRLYTGPIPVAEALALCEDVARGLVAVHAAGVVHRDVKPGNILLSAEGRAKVADFSIAKEVALPISLEPLAERYEAEGTRALRPLTPCGESVGTLAYVSPEQALRNEVDCRSDLYALGVTLFEAIAGEPPFDASLEGVLERIMCEEPQDIRETYPDCPEPVALLLMELLAKDPELRPGSAQDLADRLQSLCGELFPDYQAARVESTEAEGYDLRLAASPGPRPHSPGPPTEPGV